MGSGGVHKSLGRLDLMILIRRNTGNVRDHRMQSSRSFGVALLAILASLLPSLANSAIVHEGTLTAMDGDPTKVSLLAVNSITSGTDQLYIAAVAIYGNTPGVVVDTITGGSGLTWTLQKAQCSRRLLRARVEVWQAFGSPGASFNADITLTGGTAVISAAVSRYSGADSTTPTEGAAGSNTAGLNGICDGLDEETADLSLSLTSSNNDSVLFVASHPRNKAITVADGDYTQQAYIKNSDGGDAADLYVHDRTLATFGTDSADHTIGAITGWDMAGLVINPAATGPIAHWTFDEGTGQTAGDSSGNLNDGTLGPTSGAEPLNDPTWVCVVGGNALDFDGTDDEVKLSFVNIGDSAAWSLTAWIKMSADTAAQRTIYSEGNTGAEEYLFLYVDDTTNHAKFWIKDLASGMSSMESTTNVEDDAWHLITLVQRSKTDRELYVGTSSESTNTYDPGTLASNTASIGFLRASSWTADSFLGMIDDVRIYDYALSTGQIATLAASPPSACAPAVTSAVAEISPNDVITSSTANSFSYDIQATIGVGDTGVNKVAITVPGSFTVPASPVTDVLVGGVSVGPAGYTDNTVGNDISVDLTTKVIADTRITVLFNADAPITQDPTGVNFISTVDDSATGDSAQSTTMGDGDGDVADNDSWTVTTTDGGFAVLLVAVNKTTPTAQDAAKKTLIESWGYTVTLIEDTESQAAFDTAVATSDVAYISEEITSTNLDTKLTNACIGVVNDEEALADELGFASGNANYTTSTIDITNSSHYITSPFSIGSLTITTSAQSLNIVNGTIATGAQFLAVQPPLTGNSTLTVIEVDGTLTDPPGGTAAGRRVYLPWGDGTFDINALNTDGKLLMRRAIEWGTAGGACGAIGHWNFDEGTGQTAADSAGTNDGTLGPTTSADAEDPTWACVTGGNALDFDGTDDYVDIPPIGDGYSAITVSAWMKARTFASPENYNPIVAREEAGDDINDVFALMARDEGVGNEASFRIYVGAGNTKVTARSNIILSTDTWYHLVGTYDGADVRVYLDGIEKGNAAQSGTLSTEATRIALGKFSNNFYVNFDGLIDEVRIYDRALSPAEISALAASPPAVCGGTTTTIDNVAPPGSVTIGPGATITDLDNFSLIASSGTDTVTAATVTLVPAGAFNNIGQADITDVSGAAQCTAITNPVSNILSFTGCSIPVTTTITTFKVRITPRTHANMPVVPGASYAVTGTVTAFTSTNTQAGSDTGSAEVTVDNLSPSNVTGASSTPGDTQVTVNWTNPGSDFSNVLVLRNTATIVDVPTEGSSPAVDSTIGTSVVRYIAVGTSFIDTGLMNGTPYFYRIFAKDIHGNYADTGVEVSATPTVATGPIAHWTFDDGTGPTAADSAGSNDGTLTNGPTWTCVAGGNALTFDGSDDYVDAGSAASLDVSNGTVSAWFKADTAQVDEHVIVDKNQSGFNDGDFILMIQDSDDTPSPNHVRLYLEDDTSSISIFADAPVTFGTWTHVTVTFGSSGMAMYINGVKQADTNANTSGMDNTVPSLFIGRQATDSNDMFDGAIDEVRIYDRVLSQAEITALAASAPADCATIPTPLGRYCFNEAGSGTAPTTVLDDTANPVNLSITYDTGIAWFTHASGHLGLNAATDPHVGVASGVANGTKYSTNLDGATQATFSVVADWLPAADSQRIGGFFRSGSTKRAYIMVGASGEIILRFQTQGGAQISTKWPTSWEDGVRRVFHVVFDSDHLDDWRRVRLYMNGVDQGTGTIDQGTWPTPGAGLDFNAADDLDLSFLNELGLLKPLHGTVYHYAVYDSELTDAEIAADASALLADDDCAGTAGPIAHWTFDEGSGDTAADSSGNGYNATLGNAAGADAADPTWECVAGGYALSFDGTNDIVDAGSPAGLDDLGPMTLAAWIRPDAAGNSSARQIMSKSDTGSGRWFVEIDNTAPEDDAFEFNKQYNTTDIQRISSNSTVVYDVWQHVAVTWDGSDTGANIHIYKDGVETTYQSTINGSTTQQSDAALPFNIGNRGDGSNPFFGLIDDVRVYGRILSSGAISTLAASPPTACGANTTTIGNAADPGSVTIAPGAPITDLDNFSLVASSGTDTVTAATVTLVPAGAFNNIGQADITDVSGAAQCTAITNPVSNILSFTGCSIPVTTTITTFKVRITPRTHANMPVVPGASYAVTGTVTAFTSTNTQAGSDTGSAEVTVDNLSPSNVTGASSTPGDTQVTVNWTNPGSDFSNVLVLRNTATIVDVPTEGSSPAVDSTIGTSVVRYIAVGTSFIDTGLMNGTPYFYRIFAKDIHGNYADTGVEVSTTPSSGPAIGSCPAPSVVFADGFESGDLSAWDSSSTGTGDTIGASTVEVNTGTYSVRGETDSVADASAYVTKDFAGETTVVVQAYIYLDPAFAITGNVEILYFNAASPVLATLIKPDLTLQLWNQVAGENYLGTTTITKGVWHVVEMEAVINGTTSEARLWLDGNLEVEQTGIDLGLNPITRLKAVRYWSQVDTEANIVYFDDIVLCDQPMTASNPAVTSAVAEISPNDVTTSSTANAFSYDIKATMLGGDTGVNRVTITVPVSFGAPTVTDVLVNDVSVARSVTITGNDISIDLTAKVIADSRITVLFNSDAPITQDLIGVNFVSTVDDSGTNAAAQSTTEGNGDGDVLDANSWAVTTTNGLAVSAAVAEISPNDVVTSSTGNSFSYDIKATISGNDTGVNTVTITVPGSFGAPTITAVQVDGGPVAYTPTITGNDISIQLITKVTTSSKITIVFDADAPAAQDLTGVNFISTVDDSGTSEAAQATTEGDGDGNAGDNNSWTVTTTGGGGGGGSCLAVDGNASTGSTTTNSLTISHTTAGTDRLMIVGITIDNNQYEVVSTVTYNSIALTFVGQETNDNDARVEIWQLSEAGGLPTGTHDVDITFDANLVHPAVAGVITFTGVDQTTPLGSFFGNQHVSSNPGIVTVNSANGEMVLGVFSGETVNSVVTNAPATERWNLSAGGTGETQYSAGSTDDGAASVSMVWSLGKADHWAAGGVSIKPAASCSGTAAVTSSGAEISPNNVTTSSTGNAFSYDILANISGAATGVNRITITVPGSFGAPTVIDVEVDGTPVAYSDIIAGNDISVDLTTKVTATSQLTVLFDADAPITQDLAGVDFVSTVDDSGTADAPQSTTEGNGDGDAGDSNSWTVFTTNSVGAGALSHWPLDETAGVTAADVESAHDGTYTNGPTLNQVGACSNSGTAAYFGGEAAGQYVVVPHHDDYLLDNGTISLWAKLDEFPNPGSDAEHTVFSKDSTNYDTGGHVDMRVNTDGTVEVRLQSDTASNYITSAAIPATTWMHLVVVK